MFNDVRIDCATVKSAEFEIQKEFTAIREKSVECNWITAFEL